MASGIFLISNGELIELSESRFESEDIFQSLLEDYPNLLSGDLIDPENPRQWILVSREMGIEDSDSSGSRWSVDHLFLDQDGIPTLVEVKRSTDTRIRREVIGQMLDYAANAVAYWPIERIITEFEKTCQNKEQDPEEIIQGFSEQDPEEFWEQVKTNIKAGKIRMIFLADEIPLELKRVVEFLNEQMDPAVVLALEIRRFKSDGLQTLVPKLFGNTSEAENRKGNSYSRRERWTKESFFNELSRKGSEADFRIAKRIYDWAQQHCDYINYGKGKKTGSMIPVIEKKGRASYPFAVWTTGFVEIYFFWYTYREPFTSEENRLEIVEKLNQIPGIKLQESDINKRPNIKLEVLDNADNLEKFFEVFEWFKEQLGS